MATFHIARPILASSSRPQCMHTFRDCDDEGGEPLKGDAAPSTPSTHIDEADSVSTDLDSDGIHCPDGLQCPDDEVCDESNTDVVFCLSQLVALQMAVRCSIERACVVLPSESIAQECQLKLQDMWRHSLITVNKYADTAERVATMIFPDLQLAIHEGEQSLAVSLLDMVRCWVEEMKQDGEAMKLCQTALRNRLEDLAAYSAGLQTVSVEVLLAAESLRQCIVIVNQCCAFWASMLASLDRTSDLAVNGEQAHIHMHLSEFSSFWQSLGCQCKQYCKDLASGIN